MGLTKPNVSEIDEGDLKSRVMEDPKIIENLDGKKIIKTIVVPKKLVNLVVRKTYPALFLTLQLMLQYLDLMGLHQLIWFLE